MGYIVKYGQNLMDIALQELGNIEGVLRLAIDNNLSITADLGIGQIIKIDTTKIIDKKIVEYYKNNNVIIATDIPRPNKSQAITFSPIGALGIGDVVTLNAVASSGLTVLYFSSNPLVATIVNNTLTVVGAGNVTITASQVGDSIFYPASVGQIVTITNITLDETNLVFDFDFQATTKQSIRDGIYLENYVDRGVFMGQTIASSQPIIDAIGLKFDGTDDVMNITIPNLAEILIVCNNTSLVDEDVALFVGDFEIAKYTDGSMLDLGLNSEIRVNNIISNIGSGSFLPKEIFKSVSLIRTSNVFTTVFELGGLAGNSQDFYWEGYIKRILIFDEVLSEERRTALQEYLTTTYSL